MKKMDKKAFTLIELIVVIAILGVLVLLASPRFFGYTHKAEITKGFANAKSIEKASELYYMDYEDWPRLTDEPYTSEEIKSYSERIFDRTGQEANLDPEGNYYDIDYDKLSEYIQVPDDKKNYILQNPVGTVYYMENLNEVGVARVDYYNVKEEDDNPIPIGEPIDFAYTGQPQSVELEKGKYKLEVWGAQGGNPNEETYGGKGGYSVGELNVDSSTSLLIYVGGTASNLSGGWNGGGSSYSSENTGAGGGGATDIRISEKLTDRIIVAGGGGGANFNPLYSSSGAMYGGAGGGLIGIDGRHTYASSTTHGTSGSGGTQSKGGSPGTRSDASIPATAGTFGYGGNGANGDKASGGGGGGGYYGGGGGTFGDRASTPGGGGSGYIGGIQNGQTVAGDQLMPNLNGGAMIGNSGHGFARITRVDSSNVKEEDTFEFTATFTNAGSTGCTGPSQSQLDSAYAGTLLAGQVVSDNGIQLWTVPETGKYRIKTYGAQGGGSTASGKGAIMIGDFYLTKGEVIRILVGQMGYSSSTRYSGGGGTFVVSYPYNTNESILTIAGGGGGGKTNLDIRNASITASGKNGTGTYNTRIGGTSGNGGGGGYRAQGGAGFFSSGSSGENSSHGFISQSFTSGGTGGNITLEGGFGGGGTEGNNTSWSYPAGGGGYSGGGAGGGPNTYVGGGGGSYNSGTNQSNSVGNTGHGKVIITYIGKIGK